LWNQDERLARLLTTSLTILRFVTVLVAVAYLANIAGSAICFTRIRFRLPGDILLAVFSAIAWYCVADRWLKFRSSAEHTLR
jgi:hypothetical protein